MIRLIIVALTAISWFVLVFYFILQLIMLTLAVRSASTLRREKAAARFGRKEDMLSSDLAPPVSFVIPAYNEAAGIVESTRSLLMASYARFEIVIANDGSTDDTLRLLIDAFDLKPVAYPLRTSILTAPVRAIYKSRRPGGADITVVDKENGGRADALNAAVNAAKYPYILATDADVILDDGALVDTMRLVAEDRERVVAVGGNIRPLNGGAVRHGHVVDPSVPRSFIARYQVLEYVRSFVAAKPAWAALNALPNVSGAFGILRRDVVIRLGGYTHGHFGEDLDLTMRIHRDYRDRGEDYRIAYAPAAVIWTEVPQTRAILRRQRIRWHRGLMTAVSDFRSSFLNPKHGPVGMLMWPFIVIFEFLAPIVEFTGYLTIPLALYFGWLSFSTVFAVFFASMCIGAIVSLFALFLDERYAYFNGPAETARLVGMAFIENLGVRQMTVWWRIRAMMGGKATKVWGDMERRGVTQLAS
ncbi:MAG: glycosyltransferase family 2 protein [Acidimicrobiia bacterium]|nr:glycosyltransferase family 2 protein [Acidimicrobiia bacterium]